MKRLVAASVLVASSVLQTSIPTQSKQLTIGEVFDLATEYLTRYNTSIGITPSPVFSVGLQGQKAKTDCINTHVDGSYFCPANNEIVIEPVQVENLRKKFGDGAVLFVLAHEYAHFMQWKLSTRLKPPYHELQADCISGAILLSGETSAIETMGITADDAYEMVETAYDVGGGHIHGTSEQRANAFISGARSGLSACGFLIKKPSTGQTVISSPTPKELPPIVSSPTPPTTKANSYYEDYKNEICLHSYEQSQKPFNAQDRSTYTRTGYLSQLHNRSDSYSWASLNVCVAIPGPGTLELNIPTAMTLAPPKASFKSCVAGVSYKSPAFCIKDIKADINYELSKSGKSRWLIIRPHEQLPANTLYKITLDGIKPLAPGNYALHLWIHGTFEGIEYNGYEATYTLRYK